MEKTNNVGLQQNKGGRKPKIDPCKHRMVFYLNDKDYAKFLSLFEESGMHIKAHFITACIFQKTIKTVKIDKVSLDFYTKLTHLNGQFRAIGVNYNQIVKQLNGGFTEKKARFFLYKLEKETIQLAIIGRQILELCHEFEQRIWKS